MGALQAYQSIAPVGQTALRADHTHMIKQLFSLANFNQLHSTYSINWKAVTIKFILNS